MAVAGTRVSPKPHCRHSREGGNPTLGQVSWLKLDPRLRGDDGIRLLTLSENSILAQQHLVNHGTDDRTHDWSHDEQPELL